MLILSSRYAPVGNIIHRKNTTSTPFPLSGRDFGGVDSGVTVFQTTVRDDSIDGKAEARFVTVDGTARAGGLFRCRKAAPLRPSLGEIEEGEVVGGHRQRSTLSTPTPTRSARLSLISASKVAYFLFTATDSPFFSISFIPCTYSERPRDVRSHSNWMRMVGYGIGAYREPDRRDRTPSPQSHPTSP